MAVAGIAISHDRSKPGRDRFAATIYLELGAR